MNHSKYSSLQFIAVTMLILLMFASPLWALHAGAVKGAKPRPNKEQGKACYSLWHDHDGWHLLMSTENKRRRFTGRIWTKNGSVRLVRTYSIETKDRVVQEGSGITFQSTVKGGSDGFTFKWTGSRLWLSIEIDGKPMTKRILVGPKGLHPSNIPFTIDRNATPRAQKKWVPGHYDKKGTWVPGRWIKR